MALGRKKQLSNYLSAAKKKIKNIQTRRTKTAIVQRGISRLGRAKTNKRLK